jgi:hypothetical protein
MAEAAGLPLVHIPVTAATKPQAEARPLELVDQHNIDLVVLARYMRILSDNLCNALAGRAINIHHSFLPGFKGRSHTTRRTPAASSVVDARAHYVTADLDETRSSKKSSSGSTTPTTQRRSPPSPRTPSASRYPEPFAGTASTAYSSTVPALSPSANPASPSQGDLHTLASAPASLPLTPSARVVITRRAWARGRRAVSVPRSVKEHRAHVAFDHYQMH